MKTKQVEIKGLDNPVLIWKMNNGFRQDWIEKIGELVETTELVNNKEVTKREVKYNNKKMRFYSIVYGVFEASEIGFNKITESEIKTGLNDLTENNRLQIVRNLNPRVAEELVKEISDFNKIDEEEVEEQKKN